MPDLTAPDHIRRAFLATSYGTAGERFRLTVQAGRPCRLFAPGEHWAILTAHNQHGVRQEAAHNERQQRQLEDRLSARFPGLVCQRAVNGEGEWAEASLLVRGMTLRQARDLGNLFAQAAVLWGSGQRAALVWCGPQSGLEQPGFPPQIERLCLERFCIERFWVCTADANPQPSQPAAR